MAQIRIISLYSGSGGNATLIECPSGSVLIDAGKSARSLCLALKEVGSDIENISAVFVTHEHTDHISALEMLAKKHRIPVHITEKSAEGMSYHVSQNLQNVIVTHAPVFSEEVCGMTFGSFTLSHDSAMCVGYRVVLPDGHIFGIATDTGCITEEMKCGLCGCDAVAIESNHSTDMLRCGSYPPDVKKRILSKFGHLSNDECASFTASLAQTGTRCFILAHISAENNRPECALEMTRKALAPFADVRLCLAKQDSSTLIAEYEY